MSHRCVNMQICGHLSKIFLTQKSVRDTRICEGFVLKKSLSKISRKQSPFFSMWRNGQLSRNLQSGKQVIPLWRVVRRFDVGDSRLASPQLATQRAKHSRRSGVSPRRATDFNSFWPGLHDSLCRGNAGRGSIAAACGASTQ